MTKVYEIQSFDATDLEKFYLQTSEQIWYALNAKRIKNTPEKERNYAASTLPFAILYQFFEKNNHKKDFQENS